MSVHSFVQEPTRRRRTWLRGLCVTATLALIGITSIGGTAEGDGGLRSRLFRVPSLFRSAAKPETPAPAPTEDRFLRRVRQLMADAQQLESSGHTAAALDMARRADNVLVTASRTAGVEWPAGQRTPSEYAAALDQQLKAAGLTRSQDADSQPQTSTNRISPTVQGPSAAQVRPPTKPMQSSELLLDWGNRGESPTSGRKPIELIGADNQPAGSSSKPESEELNSTPVGGLLQHLRALETWGTVQGSGPGSADPRNDPSAPADALPNPGQFPEASGWLPDINDQNVGPIPTQVPHTPFDATVGPLHPETPDRLTVDESAFPTPAGPPVAETTDPFANPNDAAGSSALADTNTTEPPGPQPVLNGLPEPSPQPSGTYLGVTQATATEAQTEAPRDAVPAIATLAAPSPQKLESNLLIIAAVQVLATFFGVLLAILVFRAVAIRIWGPGMGLIVQTTHSGAEDADAHASEADLVPFVINGDSSGDAASGEEADEETEMPDPASIPFRLVGSSYEDERQAEEQAEREREVAILKSVFDQNVNLLEELQGISKSA